MGVNQYSRKWSRLKTYGGKLAENVTQAASCDVLARNMPAIEAAGYQIVLTVHDEIISEAPDTPDFNAGHLAGLMATNPTWAKNLPLAAAGFEAYRYRKD
jgi:DNA polymerase